MGPYLLRRIGVGLLTLWGVATLVFVMFNALPADPAELTLGQNIDKASLAAARAELGLDDPAAVRYGRYLGGLLPIGHAPDLGKSYQSRKDVWGLIAAALPGTVVLALAAMLFATVVGTALGAIAAARQGSCLDRAISGASVLGVALPSYLVAVGMAFLFGFVWHRWTGLHPTGSLYEYTLEGRTLALRNLVLPALTLGIRPLATVTQLARSAFVQSYASHFFLTARAKGLPWGRAAWGHALKASLPPIVTAVSGWLAALLAGAVFVEVVFGWNGLGKLTIDALLVYDLPVVMGCMLVVATVFVAVGILVDVLYAALDPRVRLR